VRVSIVGTGYVGLVTGACLADAGHEVICVDVDPSKVDVINAGRAPIYEEGLQETLDRTIPARLRATLDLAAAVRDTELTMIAVGTPFDGERIDLTAIREAAAAIGDALRDKDDAHVVVVKSTVVPGTTDEVVVPLLEEHSGRRSGADFGVGMNPEFLREGQAVADFVDPDRIVVGAEDDVTFGRLAELYGVYPKAPLVRTTRRTAEMIKYTSNSLLATLISFANEIANLCATVDGVDARDVMAGVKLDRRFSPVLPDGTRVTPGSLDYLDAGCGFGGSCFPKDVHALTAFAAGRGMPLRLLEQVMAVNDAQPLRMLDLLGRHFAHLAGVKVAVLGLAFKPGTDDLRCSPALTIIDRLLAAGADVRTYDPIVGAAECARMGWDGVTSCASMDDAVRGADAVLVVTRWHEFAALPEALAALGADPVVVDGRRMLDPGSVPRYEGIGR
jgi:UDPglucose 6-dehydrogenase/GDP-mannose 6-dehydrogenase